MKAVTLYRPMNIDHALNDFDRYIGNFFGDSPFFSGNRMAAEHLPVMDVRETETAYVIEAELPGYDEKNIQIHLDGGMLTIESKRDEARKEEKADGNYIVRERHTASFSRSFQLPENADPEAINAGFKNGLLILEIKKRAHTQKKVIEIQKN